MHRPLLRFWRYMVLTPVLGVFGLGILWTLGLISFIITIMVMSPASLNIRTDGIVVLTGGTDRVRTGLELLERRQGRELLISGVHKNTDLTDLLNQARMTKRHFPCCITLGFQAADTAGNARETAQWVHKNRIKTLRLVTANYHMPRAYLETRLAVPDVSIRPHPVRSSRFDIWSPKGLTLVFEEYHKTMIVGIRWVTKKSKDWWYDVP